MREIKRHQHQSGIALIVAMILLLVMTLLGISSLNTASLEEKMAGNIQQASHAFQAAEAGLSLSFSAEKIKNYFVEDADDGVIGNGITGSTGLLNNGASGSTISAGANYTTQHIGTTTPTATADFKNMYSATEFQLLHFQTQATATSRATSNGTTLELARDAAKSKLTGGAIMVAAKPD